MPRIPNALIYLSAFIRPKLLRPDIRVPHIGYVDYPALRREGFNAVVVDKDNCVTLPDVDEVYPPFKSAWNELLGSFPPGRVLIVSNSAGTKKDPGGIAAEAVSLNLKAPVLMRQTSKPGCSSEILAYFRGQLGAPTTLRGQIHAEAAKIIDIEKQDEKEMLGRWIEQAEKGTLLEREPTSRATTEEKMVESQRPSKDTAKGDMKKMTEVGGIEKSNEKTEDLRILVIGDRLFTDTLLALRLGKHLSPSNVLSIHTSFLPQPNDVKFLRWVEDRLTKGRLREGPTDWSRFTRNPYDLPTIEEIEAVPKVTLKDRLHDLREDIRESRLRWDPRTWTLFDLTVGLGRGVSWFGDRSWRLIQTGSTWTYNKIKTLARPSQTAQSASPPTAITPVNPIVSNTPLPVVNSPTPTTPIVSPPSVVPTTLNA